MECSGVPPSSNAGKAKANEYQINSCFAHDPSSIVEVYIKKAGSVGDLRATIQLKRPQTLRGVEVFDMWKLKDPILIDQKEKYVERVQQLIPNLFSSAVKLLDGLPLKDFFKKKPVEKHVHIVVWIPIVSRKRERSPEPDFGLSKRLHEAASSQPPFSSHWSPRSDTVHHLYEMLKKRRLVQVRGTPGSGKSTLMSLLHAHVIKTDPEAFVYSTISWPECSQYSGDGLTERLRKLDPLYPRRHGPVFLLVDDAQDSYKDGPLWNNFLKPVSDGNSPAYRVALFCSYGSPTRIPVNHVMGTPLVLGDEARVSLWPAAQPIGLLLNYNEFNEVVSRAEHRPLRLDVPLSDFIYGLTRGHVGAVIKILEILSGQEKEEPHRGTMCTIEMFCEKYPVHTFMQRLAGGAFDRGLPSPEYLSANQDVVAVFRELLSDGVIVKPPEHNDEAIQRCHRSGWIYSYSDQSHIYYIFSSPLHASCLSWRLHPVDSMPHFASILDLSFEVVSKFKPSQLHLTLRRIGGAKGLDPPPEAQYRDEFYRSLFIVTHGSVRISPEFASDKYASVFGRIDFFIPGPKWGIEITRDGNRLNEHGSRFIHSGAYGKRLLSTDMVDYILLDCRKSVPQKPHPSIPRLFHAVFSNEYESVTIYNNFVQKVMGPVMLLENHK